MVFVYDSRFGFRVWFMVHVLGLRFSFTTHAWGLGFGSRRGLVGGWEGLWVGGWVGGWTRRKAASEGRVGRTRPKDASEGRVDFFFENHRTVPLFFSQNRLPRSTFRKGPLDGLPGKMPSPQK